MAVAPLGGGESPRGRWIGRCGIGDYGIEKSSSIGQNGDDGEFLLKKTHLIFHPENAISLKIFIFLKTHFKRLPRKRGLPARPRPCLCHECARVKNPCFFPLALPFFLSQARPSDDRYLLRFILSTLRQVRFGAGQKAAD